jgi:hypothetical protein
VDGAAGVNAGYGVFRGCPMFDGSSTRLVRDNNTIISSFSMKRVRKQLDFIRICFSHPAKGYLPVGDLAKGSIFWLSVSAVLCQVLKVTNTM